MIADFIAQNMLVIAIVVASVALLGVLLSVFKLHQVKSRLFTEQRVRQQKNDMILWLIGEVLFYQFYNAIPSLRYQGYELNSGIVTLKFMTSKGFYGRRKAHEPRMMLALESIKTELQLHNEFRIGWLEDMEVVQEEIVRS